MNLDASILEARRRKEDQVAATPEDADLRPIVIFERKGRAVFLVESPTMDKEAGLFAARIGAGGYGADTLTIILDAHLKMMKPGEALPRPGELQNLCDEEGACDLDLISDTIIVGRTSLKTAELACLPYKYHFPKTVFRWTHGAEEQRTSNFDGYVNDCLIEALETAQHVNFASSIQFKWRLDRATAQAKADRATTIALESMDFKVTELKLIIDPTSPAVALRPKLILPAAA